MNWFSLMMLGLSILRALRKGMSKEDFVATASGARIEQQFGSDLIGRIWENRDEILEFVLKLISMFSKSSEEEQVVLASIEE